MPRALAALAIDNAVRGVVSGAGENKPERERERERGTFRSRLNAIVRGKRERKRIGGGFRFLAAGRRHPTELLPSIPNVP